MEEDRGAFEVLQLISQAESIAEDGAKRMAEWLLKSSSSC